MFGQANTELHFQLLLTDKGKGSCHAILNFFIYEIIPGNLESLSNLLIEIIHLSWLTTPGVLLISAIKFSLKCTATTYFLHVKMVENVYFGF